jgi:hypothetical protein
LANKKYFNMGLPASTPSSTNAVKDDEKAGSGGDQAQQSASTYTAAIAREATDETEVSVGAETRQIHDKQNSRDKQSKVNLLQQNIHLISHFSMFEDGFATTFNFII